MANFIPPANGASMGSNFCVKNLETDRQTDKQTNSLTPFTGVCRFFLSVKFATFLLALLARDKKFASEKSIALVLKLFLFSDAMQV